VFETQLSGPLPTTLTDLTIGFDAENPTKNVNKDRESVMKVTNNLFPFCEIINHQS
jgi:hypothetical protein